MVAFPGKTFIKTIWREIRSSFGRFFAIFAIVALGTGFLAGLLATTPDMRFSMDRYFDDAAMMDIFVKGTLGLSPADAEAAARLNMVEKLLPLRVIDTLVQASSGEMFTARIYGRDLEAAVRAGAVNRLDLLEGRMPRSPSECLVEQSGSNFVDVPLGTVITLPVAGESADELRPGETETFKISRFSVTGIVKSPLYISTEREPSPAGNGRIGAVFYVAEEAYALPVYTDFYITLKGAAALTSFTDEYQAVVDAALEGLGALGRARSVLREEEVRALARETALKLLAEAEEEYLKGRERAGREFAEAERELASVAGKIAAARAELESGAARLEAERRSAEAQFAANEEAMRRGAEQIATAKVQLADAKAQLDANREQVEQARASFIRRLFPAARRGIAQYDEGLAQYEAGLVRLAEEERRLEEGRRLLEEGKSGAETAFRAAETEIFRGRAEIEKGLEQLSGGRREFESRRKAAEAELAEAERKIRAGREESANLEIPESRWYVLDRNANVGAVTYGMNIQKIADLSKVFPLFFMLVAALVALTTMTRMVEEERSQIGTLKALGYRKRMITAKYLVYCGITGVLGCAAGMAGGFRILPIIIYNAFGTMYHLPPVLTRFNWTFALISCGLVLACTAGATLAACYQSLWEKPASLLLPRSPKPGRRIFLEYIPFIWRRLKFTYKITARNLLRYKKHFFMTVTGIAGCTALMLTAFGIRDSLVDIARTQFSRILKYNLRIELKEGEGSDSTLMNFLSRPGITWTAVRSSPGYVVGGRARYSAVVYAPQNGAELGNFITLKNRKSKKQIDMGPDAVIVTEKISELLGAGPGGSIVLDDGSGLQQTFTVTGVTENYVGVPVYLGITSWEKLYGKTEGGSFPILLVKTPITETAAQDRAVAEVLSGPSVAAAEFTSALQESWNRLLFSISFVVLVLLFAAGGLGGTVLFNLTNINITERSRELATLRVLGFRRREAAFYIYREIAILTIIGAAAGLALGIPLHGFIISVAENPDVMFGRVIRPLSFVLSALFTLVFSGLVDVFMAGKINRINMAESLKSPD
jgi:putative ABC transport system permease protein